MPGALRADHDMPSEEQPQILFLDAHDSFSNNIVSLLETRLFAKVEVVTIDDERFWPDNSKAFENVARHFDAIVVGPGPGNPLCDEDVGLIKSVWNLDVPVLGICLGFQSLGVKFGGVIERLSQPRHGLVANIECRSDCGLFHESQIQAVQYNSLRISLPARHSGDLWSRAGQLQPLAWVTEDDGNGPILMAIRHVTKPFWAVQFHPESICTSDAGRSVIDGWWKRVQHLRPSKPKKRSRDDIAAVMPRKRRSLEHVRASSSAEVHGFVQLSSKVDWKKIPFDAASATILINELQTSSRQRILLESGTRVDGTLVNSETGRFSILACVDAPKQESVEYFLEPKRLRHKSGSSTVTLTDDKARMWPYLRALMTQRRANSGPSVTPFWGGFVGFVSYEACLETLSISPDRSGDDRPDSIFVFVTRSIVIDHVEKQVYVQTIALDDRLWIDRVAREIQSVLEANSSSPSLGHVGPASALSSQHTDSQKLSLAQQERRLSRSDSAVSLQEKTTPQVSSAPHHVDYEAKVLSCQEQICAGNSYELCLTDRTLIKESRSASKADGFKGDWSLYQYLQHTNPAPFSAFMHLETSSSHAVSILSSSPERFMSWSRSGKCQFRPIKGTVKKGPGVTQADADRILSSSKERAENLMIVDLIRHDLHGVAGSGNVHVSKLMSIEEYETVWQLVSVIEGQLPQHPSDDHDDETDSERDAKMGIDVLAASLPPGSMTGAPKKRSCELLQEIEGHEPRGIYSGVLGYLDVGGGGDFSVVIRTAVKWKRGGGGGDAQEDGVWSIGAGGAITAQSTPQGEFEEMEGKRAALLKVFVG